MGFVVSPEYLGIIDIDIVLSFGIVLIETGFGFCLFNVKFKPKLCFCGCFKSLIHVHIEGISPNGRGNDKSRVHWGRC